MTDNPKDAERLATIEENFAIYDRARERGFKHHGPGQDTFSYDDMDLMRRLLASRDATIADLERKLRAVGGRHDMQAGEIVKLDHEAADLERQRDATMESLLSSMRHNGVATGHGDTIADLIGEYNAWAVGMRRHHADLERQLVEARKKHVSPSPEALQAAISPQPTADHTERARECTCHPSEAPVPCQHKYAWGDCMKAALTAAERAGAEKRALDEAVIEAARAYTARHVELHAGAHNWGVDGCIRCNAELNVRRHALLNALATRDAALTEGEAQK